MSLFFLIDHYEIKSPGFANIQRNANKKSGKKVRNVRNNRKDPVYI